MVTEVAAGIHRIEAPLGERLFCAYVLAGDRAVVLVDTGVASTPAETLLPALRGLGLRPDLVVISHADYDHHGGNAPIRAAFPDARFACHPADRAQIEDPERLIIERYGEFVTRYGLPPEPQSDEAIRAQTTAVPIDLELRGGERLRLGHDRWVEILHTPGHSRGHLTLFDPATATAVVADAVLGDTLRTASGGVAFPPTYRYVETYRATIGQIRALRAERLLTSHFPIIDGRDEVEAFLDLTAAFTDAVERALLDELRAAGRARTLSELISTLAPRLGSWSTEAATFLSHPLAGHLEHLRAFATVSREERDGRPPSFALVR